MQSKICILNDVRVRVVLAGDEYVYRVDATGLEVDTPKKLDSSDKLFRRYTCMNCGFETDGEETFDGMRAHLGRLHELVDPFIIDRIK